MVLGGGTVMAHEVSEEDWKVIEAQLQLKKEARIAAKRPIRTPSWFTFDPTHIHRSEERARVKAASLQTRLHMPGFCPIMFYG
jgi:hypothetical protein